jgi:ankyrin repeat protein
MGAADKGHADIAQVLLDKGAKVAPANHEKMTALAYAEKGRHADVVALLKKSGAR